MTKYDKKELKTTLNQIDSLIHKAKMELNEVNAENERILKLLEQKQSIHSKNILTHIDGLIGKTIKKITPFSKGWGDYSDFLLVECEDGQRVVIGGRVSCNLPKIEPEDMIKTGFYNEEEIQSRINYIEGEKRRFEQDKLRRKKEEFERLQKELNA